MQIDYACPKCQTPQRAELSMAKPLLVCDACQARLEVPPDAVDPTGIHRCALCGSSDLFVRKDFPQRVGVTIVIIGFAASCVAWYYYLTYLTFGILLATALADVGLYLLMNDALVCYRCGALYRHAPGIERHTGFQLETHERYRQQAARLAAAPKSAPPVSKSTTPVANAPVDTV